MKEVLSLSYAQKKYGLVALALLLAWLCWQLAFRQTLGYYLQYRSSLAGQDDIQADLTYPKEYNARKQANLKGIIEGYRLDSTAFRDNLLYQAAYQAGRQNINIVQVPGRQEGGGGSGVSLQKIVFQGNYFGLLRLLSELKRVKGIGKVRAVKLRQPRPEDKLAQTVMDIYFVCLGTKG